jgi:hypothetical protein
VLAKRPDERYGTCREFVEAVRVALGIFGPGTESSLAFGTMPAGPPIGSQAGAPPDRFSWSSMASQAPAAPPVAPGSIPAAPSSGPGQSSGSPPDAIHPDYGQTDYIQPGYGQPGYGQPEHSQPSYSQPEHSQPGYDQPGSSRSGSHHPGGTLASHRR